MKIFVLLFCFTLSIDVEVYGNINLVVQTTVGAYQGSILKTRLGKDIYSFRGIRYADAPTGRDRFKQSTPTKPHTGIFNATENGPSCPQLVIDDRPMSEDCLRLNIYTTKLPEVSLNNKNKNPNRDVVIYLHTGALYAFSGTYDFGPENMLDSDVVLVTINYRLGSLGFLSTGDSRAPGNGGFKDQVLAFRWVQKNIKNFGGNPDSVTLLGYSAGGWSISLHMISPMSKGLFHRAIAMSGTSTAQEPIPTDLKHLAIKQAELLNCPTDTEDHMFDCLYIKSPEEYANSLSEFTEFYQEPILIWTPVVEPPSCGNDTEEPFLTGQPVDLIRERKGYFVPLITGVTKDELGGGIIDMVEEAENGDTSMFDAYNTQWEKVAPISFDYERNTTRSYEISKELRSFYLGDEELGPNNAREFGKLYSDSLTIFRTHRFERLMATYSPAPVYNYLYTYEGCETYAKWSNGTRYGVVHHDELLILFRMTGFPALCDKDVKTLNRLTEIIINFAKTGQPIPPNNPKFSNVNWQPDTKNNPKHLKFDEELSIENEIIYAPRMNKWNELFPLGTIPKMNNNKTCRDK